MGYLSNAGLSYFFGKLKTIFAPISHGHGGATQSAAGFMSAADKKKLDGIAEGANKYSLPTATSSVLGGVKTGANITNNSGVLSVTATNVTNALGYTPPKQDTDTWRPVVNSLTSDSTTDSLSAAQGKALKTLVDGKAAANHTHSQYLTAHQDISGKVDKSEAGANSLLATLTTTWTAIPTDNTYFVRQDTGDGNTFGRVKFSTLWSYIKGKGDATYQPKGSYAASSHTHDDRYYTESEIDAKLKTKADTHSHPYLPTAGGTVTGVTAFTNTTASTNKSTGAVKVSGGVGVAGRMSANEVMIGDGCTLRYDATNKCVNFTFS